MNTLEAVILISDPTEATEADEYVAAYQELINSGDAWKLEGSIGREAMNLINNGLCMLGEVGHKDYWGNYVPSRYEVQEGTKGSASYCAARGN